MSDPEKEVLRALDTYKSAVLAKNVETFMHLYAPDVGVAMAACRARAYFCTHWV